MSEVEPQFPGVAAMPQNISFAFTPEDVTNGVHRLRPFVDIPPAAPSRAPAHATAEDPAILAVALVEQATAQAKRHILKEVRAELPGVLDRLAARRYAWMIAGGVAGLLGAGFVAGWLWSAQGMACDTVSYPGWKHCSQWIGGAGGVVQGHSSAAR